MDFEVAEPSPLAVLHPACAITRVRNHERPRELVVHPRDGLQRRDVEEFVRREFFSHFQARVTQFMPLLVALQDRGAVRAVVGCRSAAAEPLFLERYTREPIERVLARRLAVHVSRDAIVEIGSLACRGARAAVDIVGALVPFLLESGFSWVAFTGADSVKRVFRHMNLEPTVLCAADGELLGSERYAWGEYYRHHPEVMVGRLSEGAALLGVAAEQES